MRTRRMNVAIGFAIGMLLLVSSCSAPSSKVPVPAPEASSLRSVASFAGIQDRGERSAALFAEAAKVFQHPRCVNCHPKERTPTQGADLHPHVPLVQATASGHGLPALQCNTCHQAANVATQASSVRSIPGHPHWGLAPESMAWQGMSARHICEQLKDPARNGGRTLEKIHEHVANDTLVGWAWQPGEGRKPAPGTQRAASELIAAWIASGAQCPAS